MYFNFLPKISYQFSVSMYLPLNFRMIFLQFAPFFLHFSFTFVQKFSCISPKFPSILSQISIIILLKYPANGFMYQVMSLKLSSNYILGLFQIFFKFRIFFQNFSKFFPSLLSYVFLLVNVFHVSSYYSQISFVY